MKQEKKENEARKKKKKKMSSEVNDSAQNKIHPDPNKTKHTLTNCDHSLEALICP